MYVKVFELQKKCDAGRVFLNEDKGGRLPINQ